MQTETATTAGKSGLPRRVLIVASAVFVPLLVLGVAEAGLRAPYKEDLLRATTFFSQRRFFLPAPCKLHDYIPSQPRNLAEPIAFLCWESPLPWEIPIRPTDSAATWKSCCGNGSPLENSR
jgi:hypothetical protein